MEQLLIGKTRSPHCSPFAALCAALLHKPGWRCVVEAFAHGLFARTCRFAGSGIRVTSSLKSLKSLMRLQCVLGEATLASASMDVSDVSWHQPAPRALPARCGTLPAVALAIARRRTWWRFLPPSLPAHCLCRVQSAELYRSPSHVGAEVSDVHATVRCLQRHGRC